MGAGEDLGEERREGGEIKNMVADGYTDGWRGTCERFAREDAVWEIVEREGGDGGASGRYKAVLHGGGKMRKNVGGCKSGGRDSCAYRTEHIIS